MPRIKKTFYAKTITQKTGNAFATFNDINNLKLPESMWYAQSKVIRGTKEEPNRPSTLYFSDFQVNLPIYAVVRMIEITYLYEKVAYDGTNHINIGKPIVMVGLLDNMDVNWTTGKSNKGYGQAPTPEGTLHKLHWPCYLKANRINDKNFGFSFNLPANQNANRGYVRIRNAFITLYYDIPEYKLTVSKTKGEFNGDKFEINIGISNATNTTYVPGVTITNPVGFTLDRWVSKKGKVTKVNNQTIRWEPGIKGISSDTVKLVFSTNLIYPLGATTFEASIQATESLFSTTKTLNFTVLRDHPIDEETAPENQVIIDPTTEEEVESEKYMNLHVGDCIEVLCKQPFRSVLDAHSEEYVYFKVYDTEGNDVTDKFSCGGTRLDNYQLEAASPSPYTSEEVTLNITCEEYVPNLCELEAHFFTHLPEED